MSNKFSYVELEPYVKPPSPAYGVRAASLRSGGGFELSFEISGPLESLEILPVGHAVAGREFWRHTCFELFVQIPGDGAYWEWNFSPVGEWNLFRFDAYRKRDESFSAVARVTMDFGIAKESRYRAAIRVENILDPRLAGALQAKSRLRAAMTVVVESKDGTRQYWAPRHAAAQADFHDARSFVMAL